MKKKEEKEKKEEKKKKKRRKKEKEKEEEKKKKKKKKIERREISFFFFFFPLISCRGNHLTSCGKREERRGISFFFPSFPIWQIVKKGKIIKIPSFFFFLSLFHYSSNRYKGMHKEKEVSLQLSSPYAGTPLFQWRLQHPVAICVLQRLLRDLRCAHRPLPRRDLLWLARAALIVWPEKKRRDVLVNVNVKTSGWKRSDVQSPLKFSSWFFFFFFFFFFGPTSHGPASHGPASHGPASHRCRPRVSTGKLPKPTKAAVLFCFALCLCSFSHRFSLVPFSCVIFSATPFSALPQTPPSVYLLWTRSPTGQPLTGSPWSSPVMSGICICLLVLWFQYSFQTFLCSLSLSLLLLLFNLIPEQIKSPLGAVPPEALGAAHCFASCYPNSHCGTKRKAPESFQGHDRKGERKLGECASRPLLLERQWTHRHSLLLPFTSSYGVDHRKDTFAGEGCGQWEGLALSADFNATSWTNKLNQIEPIRALDWNNQEEGWERKSSTEEGRNKPLASPLRRGTGERSSSPRGVPCLEALVQAEGRARVHSATIGQEGGTGFFVSGADHEEEKKFLLRHQAPPTPLQSLCLPGAEHGRRGTLDGSPGCWGTTHQEGEEFF